MNAPRRRPTFRVAPHSPRRETGNACLIRLEFVKVGAGHEVDGGSIVSPGARGRATGALAEDLAADTAKIG